MENLTFHLPAKEDSRFLQALLFKLFLERMLGKLLLKPWHDWVERRNSVGKVALLSTLGINESQFS